MRRLPSVVALLLLVVRATALHAHARIGSMSLAGRALPGQLRAHAGSTAMSSDDAATRDNLVRVLSGFVRSEYAVKLCRYVDANPADCGQISGMFESVRLVDGVLDVKLTRPFTHQAVPILDRLAEQLRAEAPHIMRLEYSINGGWGSTRTWVIR